MSNVYALIKQRVETALQANNFQEQLTKGYTNWMNCPVGRRILHWYVKQNPEVRAQVQALQLSAKTKANMLAYIQRLAQFAPPGTVAIDGELTDVNALQWLEIEYALVCALIRRPHQKSVSYADVLAQWKPASTVLDLSSFLYGFCNLKESLVSQSARKCLAATGLLGVTAGLTMFASPILGGLMLATGSGMLGYCLYKFAAIAPSIVKMKTLDYMASHLSQSWDDVLAMSSMEDAILIAQIAGVYSFGLSAEPEHPTPNVLAMRPAELLGLTSRVIDNDGYFNEKFAQTLLKHVKNSPSLNIRNTLNGVDLSALRPAASPTKYGEAVKVPQPSVDDHASA